MGPFGPAVMDAVRLSTGAPLLVVKIEEEEVAAERLSCSVAGSRDIFEAENTGACLLACCGLTAILVEVTRAVFYGIFKSNLFLFYMCHPLPPIQRWPMGRKTGEAAKSIQSANAGRK
jgi:hypothetical protein